MNRHSQCKRPQCKRPQSKRPQGNRPQCNRRDFIHAAGGAAALFSTNVAVSQAASPPAGDKLKMGFIGLGGRGGALLGGFLARDDCHVVALCDVHRDRLSKARDLVRTAQGEDPATTADLHDVLGDRSIEAVVIATPDHWHAPAAVYACQANKHIYVEKPISNNVAEGRRVVEAARKYDRVVQSGMQNRSAPYNHKARDYVQSGKLGKVILCRVYNQKTVGTLSTAEDSQPPELLDWDRWNGPCRRTAFNALRYEHWKQFWDYGGGEVTNDGVHQLDLACMVLGIESLPKSVLTIGTRRVETAAETPDTVIATFEFDQFPMTFEQTLEAPYILKTDPGVRNGDLFPYWQQNATRIEIFGTKGVMFLGRHGGGWQVFSRPKSRQPVVVAQEFGRFPDPEHKEDFVQAIRLGRRPNSDIAHGHRSAALCHLANISYRVGNRHLHIDPTTETINNDAEANALLKVEYREPYTIAQKL